MTHSVSDDWSDFCLTESWLFRYRWRDSTVLDVCSSSSLFWRSFPSSSQCELQNYQNSDMKTYPTFSKQFQLQTPCDVFPSHICNKKINVYCIFQKFHVCCVFLFWQPGLSPFLKHWIHPCHNISSATISTQRDSDCFIFNLYICDLKLCFDLDKDKR